MVDAAVLVVLGVREDGQREVLGISVELSEADVHWRGFLDRLVKHGLCGVRLFVSDSHSGLKAARAAVFPSVTRQRCQFHLQQNASAYVPGQSMRKAVAEGMRNVFSAPDTDEAKRLLDRLLDQWNDTAPKLAAWAAAVPEACVRPTAAGCVPATPWNASTTSSNDARGWPRCSPAPPHADGWSPPSPWKYPKSRLPVGPTST